MMPFFFQRTLDGLGKQQEKKMFNGYKRDFFREEDMIKYIEKCCKYTWKLVCQNPPYMLEANFSLKNGPVSFTSVCHQPYKDCKTRTSCGYIQFVVWPGLFEGSSGRVIRKTEVIPK